MGYTISLPFVGLIRGESNGKKHRANGKAILMELGEERASKSITIDRSRSHLNNYAYFDSAEDLNSGSAVWDAMCRDAEDYQVPYKSKSGKMCTRRVRSDAPIGCSLIINPPAEMIIGLEMTEEDIDRFCLNAQEVLCEIEPRVFNPLWIIAMVEHHDEGIPEIRELGYADYNKHIVYEPRDDDGKYWGKLIDTLLYVNVNKNFPRLMRERFNWPLDDLDVYDVERAKSDPEYKKAHIEKKKNQGKPVTEYVHNKIHIESLSKKKAVAEIEIAKRQGDRIIDEAIEKVKALRKSGEEYEKRIQELQAKEDAYKKSIKELEENREQLIEEAVLDMKSDATRFLVKVNTQAGKIIAAAGNEYMAKLAAGHELTYERRKKTPEIIEEAADKLSDKLKKPVVQPVVNNIPVVPEEPVPDEVTEEVEVGTEMNIEADTPSDKKSGGWGGKYD